MENRGLPLPDVYILRLIVSLPLVDDHLLRGRRIAISLVPLLVERQRSRDMGASPIPVVPAAPMGLPSRAPVVTPAGREIILPTAPVPRPDPVVAVRNHQKGLGQVSRLDEDPRPVVPRARVPVAIIHVEDPVETVIEEVIGLHARGIVDRGAGNDLELREYREVDPDTHLS